MLLRLVDLSKMALQLNKQSKLAFQLNNTNTTFGYGSAIEQHLYFLDLDSDLFLDPNECEYITIVSGR